MSKRLQVLLPESTYRDLQKLSKAQGKTVADFVRESIQTSLAHASPLSPHERLSKILKFSKYEGPTGDIDTILREIEAGRDR